MSTSPLSPEDIRAAAETHRELGPEYSDAVVASFIAKVDREIAARVEARLAGVPHAEPARRNRPRWPLVKRRIVRDALAASAGALAVAGAVGLHGAVGQHGGSQPAFPPTPVQRALVPFHLRGAAPRIILLPDVPPPPKSQR
jgi:hypothetical protein